MIKIASNGGIGNRLRTMIGYASAYRRLDRRLPVFIWKDTKHAPPNDGSYGIAGTQIIDVKDIDDETVMVPGTIDVPLMHRTHDLPSPTLEEINQAYGMIEFSREVQDACTTEFDVAVHLRMTDIRSENRFSSFRNWLLDHCRNTTIYMACDEPSTLRRLEDELSLVNYSNFIQIQDSLRLTTVREAAVDMLTCIRAKRFVGTKESSFSGMIRNIRLFHYRNDNTMI